MRAFRLTQWIRDRAKQSSRPSNTVRHEIVQAFELIYGRIPTQSETDHLLAMAVLQKKPGPTTRLRAVINAFDHQSCGTPFAIRFSMRDVEFVSLMGIDYAIDKTDLSVALPLKDGSFEPHLLEFYNKTLKAGMTFIDIGANIGLYSMLAAKLVGQHGRVLSFEPNSENCRLILLSMQRNGFQNVTLFPLALGDEAGHVLFSTHIGSNGGLIPDTDLVRDTCTVVPMLRLDDLVSSRVHCIKVDVEGAEGRVMQGAQWLIEEHRPIVTSEFSLEMLERVSKIAGLDYLRFFESKGYAVFLLDRRSHECLPIHDTEEFVRDYGAPIRIEDLVFFPHRG